MVEGITTSGEFIEVVRGVPGAGKTRSLAIASRIWGEAGYPVLGTSTTARAAGQLKKGAGIQSRTLASLLLRVKDDGLEPHTVVIVDEAGMADTRSLARLVEAVRAAEGKVVLVGDDRQLPSVAAGGMYGMLWRRKGGHELTENRRQVQAWARKALERLGNGDVRGALAAYERKGSVSMRRDEGSLMETCAMAWFADHLAGIDTAMIAYLNSDTEALNQRAHALMAEDGQITEELVSLDPPYGRTSIPARTYHRGETIIFLRNEKMPAPGGGAKVQVTNSATGRLVDFDEHTGRATVELSDGERVWVTRSYLQDHTTFGYARTVYKAQGETLGRQDPERRQTGSAHVYRPERMYQEAAQVALSRATHTTYLYVLAEDIAGAKGRQGGEPGPDVIEGAERNKALRAVERAWSRSGAERPASELMAAAGEGQRAPGGPDQSRPGGKGSGESEGEEKRRNPAPTRRPEPVGPPRAKGPAAPQTAETYQGPKSPATNAGSSPGRSGREMGTNQSGETPARAGGSNAGPEPAARPGASGGGGGRAALFAKIKAGAVQLAQYEGEVTSSSTESLAQKQLPAPPVPAPKDMEPPKSAPGLNI